MNEKMKERLEQILDFYSIVHDRDSIANDIYELMDKAYFQGWSDAKDDNVYYDE